MSLWTLDKTPTFFPGAVATEAGWVNPQTGEVLVAISELTKKAGPADVNTVAFGALSYAQGDPLTIIVRYNESVDVVAGATIDVSWSGLSGNFAATAAAQTNVYDVVFSATVPLEAGVLGLAAQDILGTITDVIEPGASNVAISGDQALAAGTRVVA